MAASRLLGQNLKGPQRIGALFTGTSSAYRSRLEALRAELKLRGHEEGRDIAFEYRWAENRTEQLAPLAAELVALRPAVIVTSSSAAVAALKNATATIPVVFANVGSPVEQGFVASLRRPGGNVTGVTAHPLEAKMIEIAREALPRARRIAMLAYNPDPASKRNIDDFIPAAKRFRFVPLVVAANRPEDLAVTFNEIVQTKPDALYAPPLSFVFTHREYLVKRSLEARLPLISGFEELAAVGAMIAFGSGRLEHYRRAGLLVDKILRGANPAELPVELIEKIDLVVNLKTAKAIGVTLSESFLARANKVIE